MTDSDLVARAAALAGRSGSRPDPGPSARRRHPAGNSRILAAGLSATALFGLIAALTLSNPSGSTSASAPIASAIPAPRRTIVIIHRRPPPDRLVGASVATATPVARAAVPAAPTSRTRSPAVTTTKSS